MEVDGPRASNSDINRIRDLDINRIYDPDIDRIYDADINVMRIGSRSWTGLRFRDLGDLITPRFLEFGSRVRLPISTRPTERARY